MSFTVKKMIWERGERHGHAYVPQDHDDFLQKLNDLHTHAVDTDYPFYIEINFTNNTVIGIIVGCQKSVFDFGELLLKGTTDKDDRYSMTSNWAETQETEWIEFSYFGVWSTQEPEKLLPFNMVIHSVVYYVQHLKLLPCIKLYDTSLTEKYGQH